ncbi:MAG: 30S ribosomal protein S12 methylthiotransferase RimO, partial [Clostridia bacterium]|nr:30S ribosomal protein S12 methylthiotransferase RimO [Clostridia bacterium]
RELFVGRAYFSAPDIDGKVYFTSGTQVVQGETYKIKIKRTDSYDLYGSVTE